MATAGNGCKRRVLRLGLLTATLAGGCNAIFGIHEGTPRPICADPLMIDDMEDGVGDICNTDGRHGTWYTVGDGSSTDLTPGTDFKPTLIDGKRDTSRYAARFTGSGFTKWGALMGFGFGQGEGTETYDASGTGGIKFWMKSNAPVSVNFLIPATVLPRDGGECADSTTASNCNNHFLFQITAPGSGWVEYEVPFLALTQSGGSATWDPRLLLGVQFRVGTGAAFDVWVDDVSFYACRTSLCVPTCTDPAFLAVCPANDANDGSLLPAACRPTGTDCAAAASWCQDPLLIDDMEDGGGAICDSGKRSGSWLTAGDGTSTDLTPEQSTMFNPTSILGGRGTSHFAAHMTGSGFTFWGALMGFDLNDQASGSQPYDASTTGGIQFWMKSNAWIEVQFSIPETTPAIWGGTCTDSSTEWSCNNTFSYAVPPTKPDEWVEYTVPFAALRQNVRVDADGNIQRGSASWDPSRILGVRFLVPGNASFDVWHGIQFSASANGSFDVWVDDVRFYNCAGDACVPTCADPVYSAACPASGSEPAGCWSVGTNCSAPPDYNLYGVWGSAPNDVWAVGRKGPGETSTILHWDGSAWSSSPTDAPNPLYGVRGSGPNDVWAISDHGAIFHGGDGATWTLFPSGTTVALNAVWASGPNDAFAVGFGGVIVRWNGSTWTPVRSGTTHVLWGVWGNGPSDAWALGDAGTILRWDGNAWSASPSGTTISMNSVWGDGLGHAWAIGDAGTILYWNGAAWSAPYVSGTTNALWGVWGSGGDNVWAVGPGGTIVHWNGLLWTPSKSGTTSTLTSVWGSEPNDVWAVGDKTILHWDGVTWSAN